MENFLIYIPKKKEENIQQELQLDMPQIIIPKTEEQEKTDNNTGNIIIELF